MTGKNKKLNNNKKRKTQTQALTSLTDFPLHIRSPTFPVSVQTIITIYISSFHVGFLPVSGWLTNVLYSYMSSATVGIGTVTNIPIFMTLKNSRKFGALTRILRY
jgi:hypothetical protein